MSVCVCVCVLCVCVCVCESVSYKFTHRKSLHAAGHTGFLTLQRHGYSYILYPYHCTALECHLRTTQLYNYHSSWVYTPQSHLRGTWHQYMDSLHKKPVEYHRDTL